MRLVASTNIRSNMYNFDSNGKPHSSGDLKKSTSQMGIRKIEVSVVEDGKIYGVAKAMFSTSDDASLEYV